MEIAMLSSLSSHPQVCSPSCSTRRKMARVFVSMHGSSSSKPVSKGCSKCGGQGAIKCPGFVNSPSSMVEVRGKGTGKNKKNGNIFERWKCYECQGFGMKSCPNCGKGGLTPEQRGER